MWASMSRLGRPSAMCAMVVLGNCPETRLPPAAVLGSLLRKSAGERRTACRQFARRWRAAQSGVHRKRTPGQPKGHVWSRRSAPQFRPRDDMLGVRSPSADHTHPRLADDRCSSGPRAGRCSCRRDESGIPAAHGGRRRERRAAGLPAFHPAGRRRGRAGPRRRTCSTNSRRRPRQMRSGTEASTSRGQSRRNHRVEAPIVRPSGYAGRPYPIGSLEGTSEKQHRNNRKTLHNGRQAVQRYEWRNLKVASITRNTIMIFNIVNTPSPARLH